LCLSHSRRIIMKMHPGATITMCRGSLYPLFFFPFFCCRAAVRTDHLLRAARWHRAHPQWPRPFSAERRLKGNASGDVLLFPVSYRPLYPDMRGSRGRNVITLQYGGKYRPPKTINRSFVKLLERLMVIIIWGHSVNIHLGCTVNTIRFACVHILS